MRLFGYQRIVLPTMWQLVNMGVYILYPTKRFVAKRKPVNLFVHPSFVRSFFRTSIRTFLRSFVFSYFRSVLYPSRMAPISAKLCQNAFQTIPDIWFFDGPNFFWWNFRTKNEASNQKLLVLEELRIFDRKQQILHEKWPHFPKRSSLSVLWWWRSKTIFDFFVYFWTKTDLQFLCDGSDDDVLIWWSDIKTSWKNFL